MEVLVPALEKALRKIRARNSRVWGERTLSLGSNRNGLQEKPQRLSLTRPYRKATQVGKMNILKRLREIGRRNSANWTRNFGRRVTLVTGAASAVRENGLQ